jgi:hypothetical protein
VDLKLVREYTRHHGHVTSFRQACYCETFGVFMWVSQIVQGQKKRNASENPVVGSVLASSSFGSFADPTLIGTEIANP